MCHGSQQPPNPDTAWRSPRTRPTSNSWIPNVCENCWRGQFAEASPRVMFLVLRDFRVLVTSPQISDNQASKQHPGTSGVCEPMIEPRQMEIWITLAGQVLAHLRSLRTGRLCKPSHQASTRTEASPSPILDPLQQTER